MGYCTYRIGHSFIIISLFLFLMFISNSTLMMQGRPITKLVEDYRDEKMMKMMMIGSTPPRCERRCISCGGECEAVQVPVTLTNKKSRLFSSRGDDISNYKPMSWKCKCGNLFFNP